MVAGFGWAHTDCVPRCGRAGRPGRSAVTERRCAGARHRWAYPCAWHDTRLALAYGGQRFGAVAVALGHAAVAAWPGSDRTAAAAATDADLRASRARPTCGAPCPRPRWQLPPPGPGAMAPHDGAHAARSRRPPASVGERAAPRSAHRGALPACAPGAQCQLPARWARPPQPGYGSTPRPRLRPRRLGGHLSAGHCRGVTAAAALGPRGAASRAALASVAL